MKEESIFFVRLIIVQSNQIFSAFRADEINGNAYIDFGFPTDSEQARLCLEWARKGEIVTLRMTNFAGPPEFAQDSPLAAPTTNGDADSRDL
jgi:hypothetical protein